MMTMWNLGKKEKDIDKKDKIIKELQEYVYASINNFQE